MKHLQRQKRFEEETSFDRKNQTLSDSQSKCSPNSEEADWASRSGSQKDDQLRQKSRHHVTRVGSRSPGRKLTCLIPRGATLFENRYPNEYVNG